MKLRVEQGIYPAIVVVMVDLEQTVEEATFNSVQFQGATAARTASIHFAHSVATNSEISSQSEGTSARSETEPPIPAP